MRTRTPIALLLCILAGLVLSAPFAHAGWVMTRSNGDETLISNGMMKSTWENGSIIIDANKSMLHFIDDRRKLLASGTIDELCESMNQALESMMKNVPPEQREMMKKMMNKNTAGKTEVVKKGPGGKIAGFETTRYEVSQNGVLCEEVWLSSDDSLLKECQGAMQALLKFSSCMDTAASMGGEASYESSPEYLALFDSAMMVKYVQHQKNEAAADISVLSARDIPSSAFDLPAGYEKVPLLKLFGGQE